MITAIRHPDRTSVHTVSASDRPVRFVRAAALQRRSPARYDSALERAAAAAYVIDPVAVAGALVDRLMAGHGLAARPGAPAC